MTITSLIVSFRYSSGLPPGSKAGEEKSRETVSLSFSKVKQEYVVQNAQGGSGGAVTASFDIKGNKEA